MRQMILDRIEEIREKENNFDKRTTRWKEMYHVNHYSQVNWSSLDDASLLFEFERMLRKYYIQM